MKIATITLVVMASAFAGAAFAQDGSGHGPPKKSFIITPTSNGGSSVTAASTSATSANAAPTSLTQLFQPKIDLTPATK